MRNNSPIIIIFGITGDLSKRKLLPALLNMLNNNILADDTNIIGTSRRELNVDQVINMIQVSLQKKNNDSKPSDLNKIRNLLQTIKLDPTLEDGYIQIKDLIKKLDPSNERVIMFYMSIPSSAYQPIVERLKKHELSSNNTRLMLEKPFGYGFDSAEKLIKQVNSAFNENQIYRIDHYLAKETAQNLLAFRLHNPIFNTLWNCQHIQAVKIRALETISIEGRAAFYEQTGALRDIIQSHLMQLLSIAMMDIPEETDSNSLHKAKTNFLSNLQPADPNYAIRGQYESYKSEVNNPNSFVETYAMIKLKSKALNWADTDIYLETGKGLDQKTTDVQIEFKTPHERSRNSLLFQLQPNEGISLDLVVKKPGLDYKMQHTSLSFKYKDNFSDYEYIDAYERVLMDAIRGDQSLFATNQEVLQTWRILDPVLKPWLSEGDNLKIYNLGSSGPE